MTENEISPPIDSPAELSPIAAPPADGVPKASARALSAGWIAFIYLTVLTIAEVLTALIDPRAGMIAHGLALGVLLLHATFWAHDIERQFLMCLALAPLIRLLSLSMPLLEFPFVFWYLVVGLPLFLAAYVAARASQMTPAMIGLTWRTWPIQIIVAFSGIWFGVLEYIILRPKPLVSTFSFEQIWLPALILLIFTGFLEELIFRGLMQYSAMQSFGRFGLFYIAILFAVFHIGYYSVADVLFVFGVGLFFGWVTLKTGSIVGVTVAHGLTNIGLFLVVPFLIAAPTSPDGALLSSSAPRPIDVIAPAMTLQATNTVLAPTFTLTPFLPQVPVQVEDTTATPGISPSPSPIETETATATPEITSTPSLSATATVPAWAAPTITPCRPPDGWVLYVVKADETIASLSAWTGASITAILRANCLSTDHLEIGQKIYLPLPVISPTRPVATPTSVVLPTSTPSPTSIPIPTQVPTLTPTPVVPTPVLPTPAKP